MTSNWLLLVNVNRSVGYRGLLSVDRAHFIRFVIVSVLHCLFFVVLLLFKAFQPHKWHVNTDWKRKSSAQTNSFKIKTHSNEHKTERQWTPSRRKQIRTSRIVLSNALEYIEWHEIIEQIPEWNVNSAILYYWLRRVFSCCFSLGMFQDVGARYVVSFLCILRCSVHQRGNRYFYLSFQILFRIHQCWWVISTWYTSCERAVQSQLITLFWGITLRLCRATTKYIEYYLHSLTNSIDSMQHSLRTEKMRFAIGNVSIFKEDRDQNPLLFSSSLNVSSLCVYFVC